MKVTIHQPEHLIWLGLVDKISKADTFVILDNVQFRKNYFQNRNRIKTANDWAWLTVPVSRFHLGTKISDIKIYYAKEWTQQYLAFIEDSYTASKYFNAYYPKIKEIIVRKYQFLADLNIELIKEILNWFDVKTKIIKASDLKLQHAEKGSRNILEICKVLSADAYLSGIEGKNYLDFSEFKAARINVTIHQFYHPIYKQLKSDFIPGMSSVDLLFNYGPGARDILWGKNIARLDCPIND